MSPVENVVIAAAGMGTRLGAGKPKCLVEVCGKKLIEYQLDLLKDVKNVYMVIGFCELDVIEAVGQLRKDVIFVRNPDFQHTKTLESYHLAAKLIDGSAVFMDGDMIIPRSDFRDFLRKAAATDFLIGVSQRISADPVYAGITSENGTLTIRDFSYEKVTSYEWANVVYMPAGLMKGGKSNAFEYLQTLLPRQAAVIDRLEIDTKADLELAERELSGNNFSVE